MLSLYRPHTEPVPTIPRAHPDCMLSLYRPHTEPVPIIPRLHAEPLPTTYCTEPVPTIPPAHPYRPHIEPVPTTPRAHPDYMLSPYRPHTKPVPTPSPYLPHTEPVPTILRAHPDDIPKPYRPQSHSDLCSGFRWLKIRRLFTLRAFLLPSQGSLRGATAAEGVQFLEAECHAVGCREQFEEVRLFVCLSVCLFVCLYVCQSVGRSIGLFWPVPSFVAQSMKILAVLLVSTEDRNDGDGLQFATVSALFFAVDVLFVKRSTAGEAGHSMPSELTPCHPNHGSKILPCHVQSGHVINHRHVRSGHVINHCHVHSGHVINHCHVHSGHVINHITYRQGSAVQYESPPSTSRHVTTSVRANSHNHVHSHVRCRATFT